MESLQVETDQSLAKAPRLYDLRAMDIATVLSSLFAGAFLISRNFAALGNDDAARKALLIGFAGLLPLSFLLVLAPNSPRYDGLIHLMFQFGQAAIVHVAAIKSQGDAIKKHRTSGGLFYSRWRAAGISLLFLIPLLPILFGMILFASKLLGVVI
jgi:hypothetical protein